MKIYINDQGDSEAGIDRNDMIVNINSETESGSERETLRETFRLFAIDVLDFCYGSVDVYFDDECSICCSPLINGKCELHPIEEEKK